MFVSSTSCGISSPVGGKLVEIVHGPDLRPRYGSGRIVCAELTDRDGTVNSRNVNKIGYDGQKWSYFPPYRHV